jgi:hypothetical protein
VIFLILLKLIAELERTNGYFSFLSPDFLGVIFGFGVAKEQ